MVASPPWARPRTFSGVCLLSDDVWLLFLVICLMIESKLAKGSALRALPARSRGEQGSHRCYRFQILLLSASVTPEVHSSGLDACVGGGGGGVFCTTPPHCRVTARFCRIPILTMEGVREVMELAHRIIHNPESVFQRGPLSWPAGDSNTETAAASCPVSPTKPEEGDTKRRRLQAQIGCEAGPQASPASHPPSQAGLGTSPLGTPPSLAGPKPSPEGLQHIPAGPQASPASHLPSQAGLGTSPLGTPPSLAGPKPSPAGLQHIPAGPKPSPVSQGPLPSKEEVSLQGPSSSMRDSEVELTGELPAPKVPFQFRCDGFHSRFAPQISEEKLESLADEGNMINDDIVHLYLG